MNTLDELFKNKLDDHSLSPSSSAWRKLEASLSKKNKTIVWIRIAACLALISISWIAYQQLVIKPVNQLSDANKPSVTKEIPKSNVLPKEEIAKVEPNKQTHPSVKLNAKVIQEPEVSNETSSNEVIKAEEFSVSETTIVEVLQENNKTTVQAEKPLVIEYTLEPVAEQPQEVASRSKLQKMVDFAIEAKHSDGALTNLRQAKDDLFAFNFKKDKSKPSKN